MSTTLAKPDSLLRIPARDELEAMDSDSLHAILARGVFFTERVLMFLADVWNILAARGEDMDRHRSRDMTRVREIAAGRLVPEVLINFGTNTQRANVLQRLLPDDQRRLATGGKVAVILTNVDGKPVLGPSGEPNVIMRSVADMEGDELALVFDGNHIRTPEEQAKKANTPAAEARLKRQELVKVNKNEGLITFNVKTMPISDLFAALRKVGYKRLD